MLTKNQIVTIVCIVIAITLMFIFFFKESFTGNHKKQEIREDFPQTSPMNVLYSDSNGNLSSTDDLGLKNLTITGNGALQLGTKFRLNAAHDGSANDDWLRLMNPSNTDYGGGFAGSKIYGASQVHSAGTMSAVGALSAGSISTSGALSAGSISTSGALSAGSISTGGALSAGSISAPTISTNGLEISKNVSSYNDYGLLLKYTNTHPSYYDWSIGPYVKEAGGATFVIRGGANGHENLRNMVEIDGGDGSITTTGSITAKNRDILSELDSLKTRLNSAESRLNTAEAKLANISADGKVIKVDELHVRGTTNKYWKLKKAEFNGENSNHIKFYPERGSAGCDWNGTGVGCLQTDGYLFSPGGGSYSGGGMPPGWDTSL